MLRDDVMNQMKQAMKEKNAVRLSAIRYLWSEIKNAEIDSKVELDDEAIHAVVMKEVKKRKDGIAQLQEAGRDVAEEVAKLEVLEEFLPEMMSEDDIKKAIDEVVSSGADQFGAVMGQVMSKLKGKADGSLVQKLVKEKLS